MAILFVSLCSSTQAKGLLSLMTQEELWQSKWQEVMTFIKTNKRNPSKHRIEEHLMLNWIKHNRKLFNAEAMRPERVEKFKELLALVEENKHLNQWV